MFASVRSRATTCQIFDEFFYVVVSSAQYKNPMYYMYRSTKFVSGENLKKLDECFSPRGVGEASSAEVLLHCLDLI